MAGESWQSFDLSTMSATTAAATTATTAAAVRTYAPGREFLSQQSNIAFMVPSVALVGADLLASVEAHKYLIVKSDLVAASGYVHCKSGKPAYVDFYTALLAAKNEADPNFYVTVNDAIEEDKAYDELSLKSQELYNEIDSRFGEKWPHCEVLHFMQLLDEIGVTTVSSFDSAFHTVITDSYRWEAEFAEEFVTEAEHGLTESMAFAAINWQDVWDHTLTCDFTTVEFDGDVFIFHANW
jgi:hypothetical protein